MKYLFKIFNLVFISLLTFLLLTVAGCSKKAESTSTGNPLVSFSVTGSAQSATVAMKLKNIWQFVVLSILTTANAFPPPNSLVDAVNNNILLNQMWISIGEIEFKMEEADSGSEVPEVKNDFTGPYTIDLFDATPVSLQSGTVSTSALRRIKVQLIRTSSLPAGAPAELLNNSVVLSGTVNGNTFSFVTEEETTFEVSGPNAVNLSENASVLLQINSANLIKRIDLSAITTSMIISDSNKVSATNPCPLIDASANDLFTCFRKGLESESKLGKDDNGNFEFEDGEDSVD